MPTIIAKRASPCTLCRLPIVVGERIDFTRARGALHLACSNEVDDPEDEIRFEYKRAVAQGRTDTEAFDLCVEHFGYVLAVKALYQASPHAKLREDSYQARVRQGREHAAARRGGYRFRMA